MTDAVDEPTDLLQVHVFRGLHRDPLGELGGVLADPPVRPQVEIRVEELSVDVLTDDALVCLGPE
jgi:hypothetical protein